MTSIPHVKTSTTRSMPATPQWPQVHGRSPFFLSSPHGVRLAEGRRERLEAKGGGPLAEQVEAFLQRRRASHEPHPTVVGAIPFDRTARPCLSAPHTLRRGWPRDRGHPPARTPAAAKTRQLRATPEPEAYVRSVAQAVQRLRAAELHKVVLSRALDVELEAPVEVPALLDELLRRNPAGHVFAVDVSAPGAQPRMLVGASPELLVSRKGRKVLANPLAGSTPRSIDASEDRQRAQRLLTSEKDRHEHAIVVDAVADRLRPYCARIEVPSAPSVVATPTMWHLSSEVTGWLYDGSTSSLRLAEALHPTPAVCGHPTAAAYRAIRELEPFDRGFFTGMVGWCDADGDGEWVVSIRCAEVTDRALRLYAGAGIVAASDPEAELDETSNKLRTMLDALGLR